MEKLDLLVEDLLLDRENPRIGSVATQAAALEAIVELDTTHFKNMTRSVKEHGLHPGDSFYVIEDEEEKGAYDVVDGNRRLAALKVLHGATILKGTGLGENIIKQITKIAEGFDPSSISTVSCVLFDHRSDANDWILRRHGRGMEGEGRIAWGTIEIDRFKKDRTVLDLIDF